MNPEQKTTEEYDRPVAYDAEGRPLYAHPPDVSKTKLGVLSQVVHMVRPSEPEKAFVSDATKIKHERSRKLYPTLNLSDGEFVISAVRRHPIGLFLPLGLGVVALSIVLSLVLNYDFLIQSFSLTGVLADPGIGGFFLLLIAVIVGFITYIAYYVYSNNRFFLTNECIIQQTQITLFAHNEQTINLMDIEDASYEQGGILQQLLNYGSIRLSTTGDETTYRLTFVANPKQHIAALNDAVESFKNGRAIKE